MVKSPMNSWPEFLSYLRTMPQLRKLDLSTIGLEQNGRAYGVHVIDSECPLTQGVTELAIFESTHESVITELTEALDCGIALLEFG